MAKKTYITPKIELVELDGCQAILAASDGRQELDIFDRPTDGRGGDGIKLNSRRFTSVWDGDDSEDEE
ncbi:MAG: hypothetical protein IJ355_02525 [Prevotella sp.]|nr:hypothetical protein [Prevotella sp.]